MSIQKTLRRLAKEATPVVDGSTMKSLKVGGRIWFEEERRPYTVQARSERFIVCTKPFAAARTVIYTVIDLQERVRGTENLLFGFGAETREHCERMVARLVDPESVSEVSHRNRIPLAVRRVEVSE